MTQRNGKAFPLRWKSVPVSILTFAIPVPVGRYTLQHMTMDANISVSTVQPKVVNDPRFRAGRRLIEEGKAHFGAVEMFEVLSEQSAAQFGEESVEAATAMFEYGNALFCAFRLRVEQKTDHTESSGESYGGTKIEKNDEEDLLLAKDLMETSLVIHQRYVEETEGSKSLNEIIERQSDSNEKYESYLEWSRDQIPRILTTIGDICAFKNLHIDAFYFYLQASPLRESSLKSEKDKYHSRKTVTKNIITAQRHAVEINILSAEALLACPTDRDIVPSVTNEVLIKSTDIVDLANGYYQNARDGLQEMGKCLYVMKRKP